MGYGSFSIGLVSIIVLLGIICAGYQTEQGLPFSYDKMMSEVDNNVQISVHHALSDINAPGTGKEDIQNLGKYFVTSAVYGIGVDLAIGWTINDYCPGLYKWVRDNIWLAMAIIIILMAPGILSPIGYVILAILMWLKEKHFKKKRKKVLRWI